MIIIANISNCLLIAWGKENMRLNIFGENTNLIIVSVIILIICLIVSQINGFYQIILKALGKVLQQIFSLALEMFLLIFKIINSVEVYIVLLIDALTGKVSSNSKIITLAIGALSLTSFYTTYSGMKMFIGDNWLVSTLVTIGIQAILFSTSLRIGDTLDFGEGQNGTYGADKVNTISIVISSIVVCLGCMFAYTCRLFNIPHNINKIIYNILYLLVIVSILFLLFCFVKNIINIKNINRQKASIFFIIYFIVLSISSFFSYNSFVNIMYTDEVREIDTFQQYKSKVIEITEEIRMVIDDEYYNNLKKLLDDILQNLIDLDLNSILINSDELIYHSEEFENYYNLMLEYERINQELSDAQNNYNRQYTYILQNSNIGYYATQQINDLKSELKAVTDLLSEQMVIIQTELDNFDVYIVNNINNYFNLIKNDNERINTFKRNLILLKQLCYKEELSNSEFDQLNEAINVIQDFILTYDIENIIIDNENYINNDLSHIINTYRSYLIFLNNYNYAKKNILELNINSDSYENIIRRLYNDVCDILYSIPDTRFVFYYFDKEIITSEIQIVQIYDNLELIYRNSNLNLHPIEKNIKAFINNKLIGSVCATLAIIIDLMILFVGIILPKDINYWDKNKKYSEVDKKRILSNLFNKPIER